MSLASELRLLCAALFYPYPDACTTIVQRLIDLVDSSAHATRSVYASGTQGYTRVGTLIPDGFTVKARVFRPTAEPDHTGTDFLVSKRADANLHGAVLIRVVRNAGQPAFHLSANEGETLRRILDHWSSCYYLLVDEQFDPSFPFFVRAVELQPFLPPLPSRSVDLANTVMRRHSRGTDLFVSLFYNCQIGQKSPFHVLTDLTYDWVKNQHRRVVELFLTPDGVTERYTQTQLIPAR